MMMLSEQAAAVIVAVVGNNYTPTATSTTSRMREIRRIQDLRCLGAGGGAHIEHAMLWMRLQQLNRQHGHFLLPVKSTV
jgi:hypothetical protein